jgi:hypothetical protein
VNLRRLAARLTASDPARLVGGNTTVATGDGAAVRGVPHRPNFIAALGSNETVFGGDRSDEIVALGDHVTIRAGHGNAYILGGPRGTLVAGSGRDMLIDSGADATVLVKSDDYVVVSGRHDRVLCSPGARHDIIYKGPTDLVSDTCRADHARVLRFRLHATTRPVASQGPVTGDGGNGNPYVTECDDLQNVDCTVSGFEQRYLDGIGGHNGANNEYVPAYKCPQDHPYLLDHNYAPFGWSLPSGVEVREDWGSNPIAVSITGTSTQFDHTRNAFLWAGTLTGFPLSSATNWTLEPHWYQIVLHCTSDPHHGHA